MEKAATVTERREVRSIGGDERLIPLEDDCMFSAVMRNKDACIGLVEALFGVCWNRSRWSMALACRTKPVGPYPRMQAMDSALVHSLSEATKETGREASGGGWTCTSTTGIQCTT